MNLVAQRLFDTAAAPLRVGRFDVLERIGEGGMGVVYTGYDPELDRRVALKVLAKHAAASPDAQARLRREAQAMAGVSHPNVIDVFDVGMVDGRVFVAMELVEGRTLTQWAEDESRPWTETLRVLCDAGRGLAAAHAEGLVHRDFKPDNVMIGDDGRVRVLDFGLARIDTAASANEVSDTPLPDGRLRADRTRQGAVVGTPAYMAPEQLRGEPADAASDQFSFCVSAFELLYGTRPFGDDEQMAAHVLAGRVREPPRDREVPEWVRDAVLRGLSLRPDDRHASMQALLVALSPPRARGRRRIATVVAVSVALGVGAVAVAWLARPAATSVLACTVALGELGEVWNEPARSTVQRSLRGTAVPYAEDTAARTVAELDRFGVQWLGTRHEACVASSSAQAADVDDDAVLACLSDRLGHMSSLVAVLGDADAEIVERAVEAARGLPRIVVCKDARAADTGAEPPPAESAAAVARVRAELVRARQLGAAGRYAPGLDVAASAATEADALGYRPLAAAAALVTGELDTGAGQYEAADERLQAAYFTAVDVGDDAVANAAAVKLVRVTGAQLRRHDDGHAWARHAEAIAARRASPEPELAAELASNLGAVLESEGQYASAAKQQRRAVAAFEEVFGADHPRVAWALNELGGIERRLGVHEAARASHERALQIRESALGPRHPDVAQSLNNLGLLLKNLDQFDEAQAYYDRALQIRIDALGEGHPQVASTLNNRASLLSAWGRYDEAERDHRRALQIRTARFGPDSAEVALSLQNIGQVLDARGDYEGAQTLHRRALAIVEARFGPDHPRVAVVLGELGTTVDHLGDYEQALQLHQRALTINEKARGKRHPRTAESLDGMGKALRKLGRFNEAVRAHERALVITREALGDDHLDVARSHNNLGLALRRKGELALAAEHYERALQIKTARLGEDHLAVATALNNIGAIRAELGDYEAAAEGHRRALQIRSSNSQADPADVATSHHNLGVALDALGRPKQAIRHLEAALQTRERVDPEHPSVAITLHSLAQATTHAGHPVDAVPMHERALAIQEAKLGSDHPRVVETLQAFAETLDAAKMSERAAQIRGRLATLPAIASDDQPSPG